MNWSLDSIILLDHWCGASHDTKIQTVDPAAGTLSRELSVMSKGYDLYLDILDSSWNQHKWRLQSFHDCYPVDTVDSSIFSFA